MFVCKSSNITVCVCVWVIPHAEIRLLFLLCCGVLHFMPFTLTPSRNLKGHFVTLIEISMCRRDFHCSVIRASKTLVTFYILSRSLFPFALKVDVNVILDWILP